MAAPTEAPTRNHPRVIPLLSAIVVHSKIRTHFIVSRYAGTMHERTEYVIVFRSGDSTAETDAADVAARLAEEGIDPIVLGDDEPGVIEGTWEVRVPLADQARAEAILA